MPRRSSGSVPLLFLAVHARSSNPSTVLILRRLRSLRRQQRARARRSAPIRRRSIRPKCARSAPGSAMPGSGPPRGRAVPDRLASPAAGGIGRGTHRSWAGLADRRPDDLLLCRRAARQGAGTALALTLGTKATTTPACPLRARRRGRYRPHEPSMRRRLRRNNAMPHEASRPKSTGTSLPAAARPATASSAGPPRPMTSSWKPRASRSSATSASARCRTCRSLPWQRMGGRGTFIQLYGTEGKWGCYVVEVPARGALNAEKHLYEEIYLRRRGPRLDRGLARGRRKRHIFEWQTGSLFSIPVNAMHRIVNATSSPALLLAGTTAPNVMNLLNNTGAVFDCPYAVPRPLQRRRRFLQAQRRHRARSGARPRHAPHQLHSRHRAAASCRSTTAARPATAASSRS